MPRHSVYDKPDNYQAPEDFTYMRELCSNCWNDLGCHRAKDNACPVMRNDLLRYEGSSTFVGTGELRPAWGQE